jgi:peptidoglycan/LPS O-acetylase OafA/YrhL
MHPLHDAEIRRPMTTIPSRRIPELDGISGVAILLAIVWHYFVLLIEVPQRFQDRRARISLETASDASCCYPVYR